MADSLLATNKFLAPVQVEEVSSPSEMAWVRPQYSRRDVDKAGATLIDDGTTIDAWSALEIINNWRSSHSYPLNAMQVVLRKRAKSISKKTALVSQRIKRLAAIDLKLRNLKWLTLSEMQDIGGCRAVVGSVRMVRRLVSLYQRGRGTHKLERQDDYIKAPKRSGYRSVHLIYRYYGRKMAYRGLKIEIQIRSPLQHAWATAVETAGTFQRQALKSSKGDPRWLRFFALMGSVIALKEGMPLVPETPIDPKTLIEELKQLAIDLQVASRLSAYGAALEQTGQGGAHGRYFLLALTPGATSLLRVTAFTSRELQRATEEYLKVEQEIKGIPGAEAVLVSVESLEALRRAYPSYFLDTKLFIDTLNEAIRDEPRLGPKGK